MPMPDIGQIADPTPIRERDFECPERFEDIASLPRHSLALFANPMKLRSNTRER